MTNEHGASGRTAGARRRFGAKRKAHGVMPGFPDLVLLLPVPPRVVMLETKSATGRLSPAQVERHRELAAMGFAVWIVRTVEDARDGLLRLGVPLRPTRLDGLAA